ncbi:HDOD domain-containing protein [Sporosarcina sp. FSL K6-1522]|uniref:EAL and HDOD domain-containing protein n=1 Tax=Sporosarcina sp. FSL K6-1522 TaxID=2921554 RepID=UPI00315B0EBC
MKDANVFVGRQPILDQYGNLFAYELLYRNSNTNRFPNIDSTKATISLLIDTFLTLGVDKVSGKSLSFINFTGELLAQDIFKSLDPNQVVIEILEDVEITPSLVTKLRKLKDNGFTIALDDFILSPQYEVHSELFELVDIIKVDFLGTTLKERLSIENLTRKNPHIQLLAEKIETEEHFISAKNAGYKFFQGYFFAKPEIITGVEIPPNVNLHFYIIKQLNAESPNIEEISELIMRDVSLSYKLLRYINTLAFGVPKKITSIKQAIVIIGLRETKKWMHFLTLREMGVGMGTGRVAALVDYSLTRAKMCEQLARRTGKRNADEYFLAGMFSLIDVIMKRSWDDVLPLIAISDEVEQALRGEDSEITPYLQITEAIERLDLEQAKRLAEEVGIDYTQLSTYSLEANRWANLLE